MYNMYVWWETFIEKTIAVCLLVQPKDATPPNFAEKTLNFAKVIFLESFPLYSTSLSCVVTAYVSLVLSPSLPHTSLFAGTVREKELGAGKAWKWCYHHKQVL